MNIFSIFKKRKTEIQEMTPSEILRFIQEYVPEFYKDSKHFTDSKEYLNHNEFGLALESLIEMANENGHYFSDDFWSELATCAEKMQMTQQAEFCRQQVIRNEKELGSKIPKGWTTIRIDDTHFQHHIAEIIKRTDTKQVGQTYNDLTLITIEKLKIFEKYGGSSGSYDYVKSKHLKILSYSEFVFIDKLIQDIKMVERGLVAKSYEEQLNNQIKESCNNNDTIIYLKNIAVKL